MKPHSQEQVTGLRQFSESVGQVQQFELGPWAVEYYTVHIPEDQRPFSMAVAAAFTPKNNQQVGVIAVSDDVPESLRGLWALHEFIDFTDVGHETEGRCAETETVVLSELISSDQFELAFEYTQARQVFYHNLREFLARDIEARGEASQYDAYDVDGCDTALHVVSQPF